MGRLERFNCFQSTRRFLPAIPSSHGRSAEALAIVQTPTAAFCAPGGLKSPGRMATTGFVARLDLHFEGVAVPSVRSPCLLEGMNVRPGGRSATITVGKAMNGWRIVLVPQLAVSNRAPSESLQLPVCIGATACARLCPRAR